jgi:hypothetical protein
MTEPKKRGRKPKAVTQVEAPEVETVETVEVVEVVETVKAQEFRNTRKGTLDLRGVVFKAGECKALTEEQLSQAHVKRAIELKLLVAE